jgi:uncharacterized membrane protein
MVVHFPIALTGVALLCVILALWRRSDLMERFSYFSIVLAALSTAVAGLAGLRDNAVHFDGSAPYLDVKILLGISLLILTGALAITRRRDPELLWGPSTMILYVAGVILSFLMTSVLGFVGGSIVYGF